MILLFRFGMYDSVPVKLFFRCHVMEVESFESEEVAKLLNDSFVSIKVRV